MNRLPPEFRRSPATTRDIVLLHSSDLHVDSRPIPEEPQADGARNLVLVLETARRLGADVVLLAGDTFESNRQSSEMLERVADLIAACGSEVVILPGNHDPVMPQAVYHRLHAARLENLHVLGLTHEEAVHFPAFDLEVWGRAHRDYGDMAPFERPPARRTRWLVAMGHGHYHADADSGASLRPSWLIGDAELAATGADYIALGHWNRRAAVGAENLRAHYSGSPDCAGTVNIVRLAPGGDVRVAQETIGEAARAQTAPR